MTELQEKKPDIGKLVHVKTAAIMLCCTERHIYNMIRDGDIRAVRLGKRGLRICKDSINTYTREHEIDPEEYYE